MANIVAKLVSAAAQIALGIFLLPHDFGVYASVVGILVVARSIQNAGVAEYLMRGGEGHYDAEAPAALRLMLAMNLLTAGALIALAFPLARLYGSSEIIWIMVIAGASIPLHSVWSASSSRLLVLGQTRSYSLILVVGNLILYAGMIIGAILDAGAVSFVLGMPASSAVMSLLGARAAGVPKFYPSFRRLGTIFDSTKWVTLGSLGLAFLNQCDYLILGVAASSVLLGQYYFAYQIPAQVAVLAASAGSILLASLGRLEGKSRSLALRKSITLATLLMTMVCCGIAAAYPALESVFWGGKWEETVVPVGIFCLSLPFRSILPFAKGALIAQGQYRSWNRLVWLMAIGLAIVAGICGFATVGLILLSASVSIYIGVSSVFIATRSMELALVPRGRALSAILMPWSVSVAAFAVVAGVALPLFGTTSLLGGLLLTPLFGSLVTVFFARIVMREATLDAVALLPGKMRPAVRRALLL